MSGCVVLSEDDLLRLAEAGLSGDRERFLTELRDLGMHPFQISLARDRMFFHDPGSGQYYKSYRARR